MNKLLYLISIFILFLSFNINCSNVNNDPDEHIVLSKNADLDSIIISSGTLSPGFQSDQITYFVEVDNTISSITVKSKTEDEKAQITLNDIVIESDVESNPLPLSVGENIISISVKAENSSVVKDYTITVTRLQALSSNENLASLELSHGLLSPVFSPETIDYTTGVYKSIDSISITSTVAGVNASVTVNETIITSGTSLSINLDIGINNIPIVVEAEDGTIKNYSLAITRETTESSDADLSNLEISSGNMDPSFNKDTLSYTATVYRETINLQVKPTASENWNNQSITVNGTAVVSESEATVSLTAGENIINIEVTAEDKTTKKLYVLTVQKYTVDIYISGTKEGDGFYTKNDTTTIFSDGFYPVEAWKIAVSGDNVYVNGTMLYTYSTANHGYWTNTVFNTIISENYGYIQSIFADGDDIYLGGRAKDENDIQRPCYWKNDEKINLATTTTEHEYNVIESIFVSNGNLYLLSKDENPATSQYQSCYWKNDEKHFFDGEEATDIYVSNNDVYIAGYIDIGTYPDSVRYASYWKNGIRTDMPETSSTANGIFVIGNTIYLSGKYYGGADEKACYWVNGVMHELEGVKPVATSIKVSSEGDVFVSGYCNVGGDLVYQACYWVNGVKYDLFQNYSRAYDIFIVE